MRYSALLSVARLSVALLKFEDGASDRHTSAASRRFPHNLRTICGVVNTVDTKKNLLKLGFYNNDIINVDINCDFTTNVDINCDVTADVDINCDVTANVDINCDVSANNF